MRHEWNILFSRSSFFLCSVINPKIRNNKPISKAIHEAYVQKISFNQFHRSDCLKHIFLNLISPGLRANWLISVWVVLYDIIFGFQGNSFSYQIHFDLFNILNHFGSILMLFDSMILFSLQWFFADSTLSIFVCNWVILKVCCSVSTLVNSKFYLSRF